MTLQIRIPTSVGDVAPVKDGALAEFFCELQTHLVRRTTRHGVSGIEESLASYAKRLLQTKQHKEAARAWLRYALSQPDQTALKVHLNKDCIIFVKFYWLLYKSKPNWDHDPAMKYLNIERKKRSDYILDIVEAGDGSHLVSDAIHSPATSDTPRQSKNLVPREEKRDGETGSPGRGSPTAGVANLDQSESVPKRATKKLRTRTVSNADAASDGLSLKPTKLVDLDGKPAVVSPLQDEGPRKSMTPIHKKPQKANSSGSRKRMALRASPEEAKAFNGEQEPSLVEGSAPDRHLESARINGDPSTGTDSSALSLAVQHTATRKAGFSLREPASPKIASRKRSRSYEDGRSFEMDAQTSSHSISEVSTSSTPLEVISASLGHSVTTAPLGLSVPGKRPHDYESGSSQTTASYYPWKKHKGSPTIDISELLKFEDHVDHSRPYENWISEDPHLIGHEEEEELSSDAMFADAVMRLPADSEPSIGCRQPLPKYPPIWAQSRQEVCETWDWFRSYQGGVYFSQNEAKGYLLSAFSSKRDGWFHNGKLIISHGGGKAESISHSKAHRHEKQTASDQNAEDFSVRALLNSFHNNTPVALLIDDKYVHFPFSLGARDITYAVLGFYKITHFWSEFQPANNDQRRVVRYKFAFQWYESQGQPWWWLTSEDFPVTDTDAPTAINSILNPSPSVQHGSRKSPVKKAVFEEKLYLPNHSFGSVYRECSNCGLMSPQVYEIGWMCLQSGCQRFWVIDASDIVLPEQLKYNLAFLELLPDLTLPVTLNIFPPPLPPVLEGTITTTQLFSKGWHCTKCGRLSCRYKWQVWECAHCKNSLLVQGAIQHARDLQSISLSIKVRSGSGDNLIFSDSGRYFLCL